MYIHTPRERERERDEIFFCFLFFLFLGFGFGREGSQEVDLKEAFCFFPPSSLSFCWGFFVCF